MSALHTSLSPAVMPLFEFPKTCIRCHVPQSTAQYYLEAAAPDGLQAICKTCSSERARHWYDANRKKAGNANKEWRASLTPEQAATMHQRANHRRRLGRDDQAVEYAAIILADPCSYCGEPSEAIDHIHASVRGGSNEWTNLTPACRRCNGTKSASPLLTFLMQRMEVR